MRVVVSPQEQKEEEREKKILRTTTYKQVSAYFFLVSTQTQLSYYCVSIFCPGDATRVHGITLIFPGFSPFESCPPQNLCVKCE